MVAKSDAKPRASPISFGSSWERRLQTGAVFTGSLTFMAMGSLLVTVLGSRMCYYRPWLAIPVLAYIGWTFFDKSPYTPIRKWRISGAKWWHHYADYFPLTLVKTADIDPDGKYIFGYHPHGVISVGAFGCFATDGAQTLDLSKPDVKPKEASKERRGFSSLFPGIDVHLVTLGINFRMPLMREYILAFGALVADKKSFRSTLSRGSGSAIAVVVGGAEESVETKEGTMTLVLEKRKGFVREAMAAGAKLVPVLAFGENDLYKVKAYPAGHPMRKAQDAIRKNFSFTMPIFGGRGVFVKFFGLMPFRKPVWVVVGAPVDCKHLPNFDSSNKEHKDALDDAHHRYVEAVKSLYNDYKDHPLQPYLNPDKDDDDDNTSGGRHFRAHSDADSGGLTIAS